MAVKAVTRYLDSRNGEHTTELEALWADEEYAIAQHLDRSLGWSPEMIREFLADLGRVNPETLAPVAKYVAMCQSRAEDRMNRNTAALQRLLDSARKLA